MPKLTRQGSGGRQILAPPSFQPLKLPKSLAEYSLPEFQRGPADMMQLIRLIRPLIKIVPGVIKHCPATSQFAMQFTLRLISDYSWVDNNAFYRLQRAQVYAGWNLCQPVFVHSVQPAKTLFFKLLPTCQAPALGARRETRNQTDPSPAPSALRGQEETQRNRPLQCAETSHMWATLSEAILLVWWFVHCPHLNISPWSLS